jgi:hypothetical protein
MEKGIKEIDFENVESMVQVRFIFLPLQVAQRFGAGS